MMQLGPFGFELSTAAFQEMDRKDSWRWATVERIGASAAEQFVGPGTKDITLSGVIYTLFAKDASQFSPGSPIGTEQIENLRAIADMGTPHMMVDGRGKAYGKWVITGVSERGSHFVSTGAPRKQVFDLSLRYYAEDTAVVTSVVSTGAGPAVLTTVGSKTAAAAIGLQVDVPDSLKDDMRSAGVQV